MAAKKKKVTEAEVDTEERENLIRDVTAEITERLVAEEEQQPVSEVESRGCCYSYRRVNLCRSSRASDQSNAFEPKKRLPQVRNPELMGKQEEGAICERFIQFNRGEAM